MIAQFERYCNPRRNVIYEWYVFWNLSQGEGEPVDTFMKRLKTQASKCEFGELQERMLLCRLIFGVSSDKLKERLLRDPEVTLTRAVNDIRAAEVTKLQLSKMAIGDRTSAALDRVSSRPAETSQSDNVTKVNCKFCGYQHVKGRCPAYGQACRKCGGKNHFARKCSAKSVRAVDAEEQPTDPSTTIQPQQVLRPPE